MTTWSQVEKDTQGGWFHEDSEFAWCPYGNRFGEGGTKARVPRPQSEGFSETRVSCQVHLRCRHPPTSVPPTQQVLAQCSSTGSMRLRTRLRSNFPKGLRLISSHTGAERERGEWELGRVASGEDGAGWRSPPPDRPAGRQSGGLDSLGALKVSGQAG